MKFNLKERTPQLIAIIGVLLLVLAVAVFYIASKNKQIGTMQQQFSIDKQELEDEYEAISMQYEGFKFSVQNDSLLYKLENEQAKVQRLQEQLKMTDAANKAEISRLKNELATLRRILKSYVQQIDSLHRLNTELQEKNVQITEQYQRTSRTLTQVSQEKQQLTEKVTLASKLDATGIAVSAVNARGKEQKRLSRSTQFVVSFLITKNITAEPGERTIFVRIMAPDGSILTKDPGSTFKYENGNLQYSMRRIVEYGGEEIPVTMYWDIEEFLMAGTYKADIFADGNLIGSRSFTMQE
ncbi:MAG: hypothetical protein GX664_04540 [Bacteroidales bacterium]|nr:hypothetical protein [Bacteroidales bacterium]